MQGVDAYITGDRQSLCLGLTQQLRASRAAQAADMHARAGGAHQLKNRVQGDGLGGHRHAAQAHARSQRAAGSDALAQMQFLRTQPDRVAKRPRVLHGAHQHLGVGDTDLGLAKAHASGFAQLQHLGQHFTLEATGQCAQRQHPRLVQVLRPKAQHFHQARFVEHRIGVGRADQAGHAAGHGGSQLGSEHAFMLMAGLAQARGQVHQAGHDDAALGVQGLRRHKIWGDLAYRQHAPVGNRQLARRIQAAGRIKQVAVGNQ